MFYLLGVDHVLKTIILLSRTQTNEIANKEDLRTSYLNYLRSYTSNDVVPSEINDQYCFDTSRISHLIEKYNDNCDLTDLDTNILPDTPASSMYEAMERVKRGQKLIHEVNPILYEIIQIVIHTLFYSRSKDSGGGTVSSAPGVIWCGNRKNWSDIDVAEFLIHEFTHNMLFLDERRYQHYESLPLLTNRNNFAISAILNKPRPLDKVFHSLVVAYEIVGFRAETGEPEMTIIHPKTSKILESCVTTISSIETLLNASPQKLVTDRFVEILGRIKHKIDEMMLLKEF